MTTVTSGAINSVTITYADMVNDTHFLLITGDTILMVNDAKSIVW